MAFTPPNPWYHDPICFWLAAAGASVGAAALGIYLIGSDPAPEVPPECVPISKDLVSRAHNIFMAEMAGTVSVETIRAYNDALRAATNPATEYAYGDNPVVFPQSGGDTLAVVSPVHLGAWRSGEVEFLGGLPASCAHITRNMFVFDQNASPFHHYVMATDEAYDAARALTD